jgi:hypothetical protein
MCARVREREDEREWGGKMSECVCEREKGREDERAREKECEREWREDDRLGENEQ